MENIGWNPWKLTTFAVMLVLATALVSGLIVANWSPSQTEPGNPAPSAKRAPAAGPRSQFAGNWATADPGSASAGPGGGAEARPAPRVPTQADTAACNRTAGAHVGQRDQTWDVAKDAIIGGAATAGLGAAAGAIAGGGSGAGKGAAIGGLVGAVGGTLYGINENRQADAAYRAAYASCMRSRGFPG
ncbi:MAG TPA: hypothetical protein VIG69_01835 [Candidatus Methylomirabilis sp.]